MDLIFIALGSILIGLVVGAWLAQPRGVAYSVLDSALVAKVIREQEARERHGG